MRGSGDCFQGGGAAGHISPAERGSPDPPEGQMGGTGGGGHLTLHQDDRQKDPSQGPPEGDGEVSTPQKAKWVVWEGGLEVLTS
jgi:hypothetical protein